MQGNSAVSQGMQEEQEVNYDEYRIWKRNSMVLYDLCLTYVLEFPALSLSFEPRPKTNPEQHQVFVGFCIGTNTPLDNNREPNALYVKQLILPSQTTPQPSDTVSRDIVGGYGMVDMTQRYGQIVDLYAVRTSLEQNAVMYCPVDPDIIVTLNDDELSVYDLQTLLQKQISDQKPNYCFQDQDGGFALTAQGKILAHGGMQGISVYDLETKKTLYQLQVDSIVNAVQFSPFYPELLAAVTDDGQLLLIDYKSGTTMEHMLLGDLVEPGFSGTALAFSHGNERVLAIGSQTGKVVLLDIAKMEVLALRQIHESNIFQMDFSPFYPDLLLTGSEDRKCVLSNAGRELASIFEHRGHTMAITAARFHPMIPNLIGSTAEDNSLQFWWPSEGAFKMK